MDRRHFFGAIAGVALAVPVAGAVAGEAAAAVIEPIKTLRLPGPVQLVRQLYLVPGSFTTPRDHLTARGLEGLGYLERTYEDAHGIYWQLTVAGRAFAEQSLRDFPAGVMPYVIQRNV